MDKAQIVRISLYVVVVIALIYGVVFKIWFDDSPGNEAGSSFTLIIAYIFMALALGITIVAAIGNIVQHPKESVKLLIGVGGVLTIALIGYAASSGELLDWYEDFGVSTVKQSKLIDTGWYLVYFVLGASVIGILVSEFAGLFKR